MTVASSNSIRDIVETTMRCHPKDCLFKANAIELIIEQTIKNMGDSAASLIDACHEAFKDAELFCPHEGIDRMPRP